MNRIFLIFFGLIFSITLHAECTMSGISIFPQSGSISKNQNFVIEGYSMSQQTVLGLNKKHSIYLKSGNKKIKLIVTELCIGQYNLTQVIVKPDELLEMGKEYTIIIDSLPKFERLHQINTLTKKYEPFKYTVKTDVDTQSPKVNGNPFELKKTFAQYGCGPSMYIVFSNPAKDQSPLLVKTSVKNLLTGHTATYYLLPNDEQIKVGHDMCSGAFDFDESELYEVSFSFMDSSGNITKWDGPGIRFSKPTIANSQKEE
ncbi:MAG TPA: hypothetical protein VJA82_03990 [Sediminibacterium sp.]|uniref:hypothetical protein n=1 Tax=Sediminibacterium sp. TaxID=1917865 RepID=UPI0008D03AF8|nr:hypothetical protein [Sediminibacterium sp.]OHC85893.1 MAG: hypothetical protein A2472_09200 [Sphingobacteriia bacterium RIFOXYC2_FULL_35_18]OHC87428.1 MAG: hypothetical protein A2546_05355 [Sphingobacteriia bacterium RIFOXYD2_FULL_35_12]HLD52440.1 hypothetical protein [Sediminibacterium sp.]